MLDKIKKSLLFAIAIVWFASLHGQTTTYGDTIFFDNFGQHLTRVKSLYMPTGSYTFADANGDSNQKEIQDNYYAVVDPRHIVDANPSSYFWTAPSLSTVTANGSMSHYTADHTGDTNGAVMVVNAGTTVNYIYKRDLTLKTGYRYLFSFWIYVVARSSQFSIEAKNATNGKTYTYSGPLLSEEGNWIKYDLNFPVPISANDTSNSVTVGLQNKHSQIQGNDYYIDDILVSRLYTDPLSIKVSNGSPACQGSSINLIVKLSSDVIPFTFLWTGPNGFTSTDQNPVLKNITTEMAGSYRVTVTDALGQTATDSTIVFVNKAPNCDFTLSSSTVDIKHNSVTCSITPEKGVTYEWDFGNGTTPDTQASVNHTFTINGSTTEFVVKLTATDTIGCTNIVSKTIEVTPFVPNVFSPNGDGVNDVFMKGFDIQVFDRYGTILYKGNEGWDGTYKGKSVDNDTYFFLMHYTDKNKQVQTKKGYVTLVR